MANRRYLSNMEGSRAAPTGLRVGRIKSYEPTAEITDEILVRAQVGQLAPIPEIGAPEIGLTKAELEVIKDDLLAIREDAAHVVVKHPTLCDPERSIAMVCQLLPGPKWEKAFRAYLARPQPNKSGGKTLQDIWMPFAEKEVGLSGREPEHLVAPAGDFSEPVRLFVQWHYPPFNTKFPEFSHMADTTNPCTRMLLRAGLNPLLYSIVWAEHWHRRESTKDRADAPIPYAVRSESEKKHHFQFNRDLLQLADPKVVLLLGRWVADWYKTLYKPRILEISNSPRICVLVNTAVTPNGEPWVERVAVECMHPEAIFYKGTQRGATLDACLRTAVELAGLRIPINVNYFEHIERLRRSTEETGFPTGPNVRIPWVISQMLRYENGGPERVPYKAITPQVKQVFEKWTGQQSTETNMERILLPLCPEWHTSLVKGLHIMLTQKAHAKMEATGWANLTKANDIQRTGGWQSLKKANANQEAQNYPNLTKAREALAAKKGVGPTATQPVAQSSNQFVCDICGKSYAVAHSLSRHKQTTHQGRRFDCPWATQNRGCDAKGVGKGYTTTQSLNKHINSKHGGVKNPPPPKSIN